MKLPFRKVKAPEPAPETAEEHIEPAMQETPDAAAEETSETKEPNEPQSREALDAALDAALEGDENVDLKALVFDMFETDRDAVESLMEEKSDPQQPDGNSDENSNGKSKGRFGKILNAWQPRIPGKAMLILDIILVLLIIVAIGQEDTPEETEGLRVLNTTYNSTEIAWAASEDADTYRVYRSRDGKKYGYLATTPETHYVDNHVRTGTTYYYKISARNGLKGTQIDTGEVVEATPQMDRPELEVTTDNGTIDLSFSAVDGALGYLIIRDGETVGRTEDTTFTDEKAEGNTDYNYRVRPYRYKNEPVYGLPSNQIAARLETLGGIEVEFSPDGMRFSWEGNENYSEYKVYSDGELLGTIADTSYDFGSFDAAATYDIKVVGYSGDEDKKSPEEERVFKIAQVPMDNKGAIEAAIQWGIDIANDDSFTYGTGRRAHRTGCYFCGTNTGPNLNKKGSSKVNGHSYTKTYCCNPFVHACFAHGAGDKNMLAACKKGKSVGMKESSYTRYGHWKKVGKPAMKNLKRGDVIVKHSHVALYIGDGEIVHAGTEGWDADSITVKKLNNYGSYEFVMRYTGNGSGTMYQAQDVEKEDLAAEKEDKDAGKKTKSEKKKDAAASDKDKSDAKEDAAASEKKEKLEETEA